MQNQIQALALLPKLSEQQLIQALQAGDGSLPAYAVMAELQARKKRSAGFAGNEAPKTSVKDDMVAQAGGLQSLRPQQAPQGVPMAQGQMPVQGMAKGGKIRFYDGDMPGDDENLSYEEKLRRYGYNPLGARVLDYFRNPNRKPLFDVAVDKIGGMFSPSSAAAPQPPAPLGARWGQEGQSRAAPPAPVQTPQAGLYSLQAASAPYGSEQEKSDRLAILENERRTTKPEDMPALEREIARVKAGVGFGAGPQAGASPRFGKPDAGITSIANAPAAPAAPDTFKPTELKLRTLQEAMADLPKDTSIEEAIAAMKTGDTSAKDFEQAKWEALMRTGIGMATTPGSFGTALATGAGKGLDSLMANRRMIQQDQIARDKEMRNLAIAQGRQGLERYDVANRTRFGETGIADKNQDNLTKVWQIGVESKDRGLQMENALKVAGVHAAASRMAQTDLGKMKMVSDITTKASDDFDALRGGINATKWLNKSPAEIEQARAAFIADRLKMIPGLKDYYELPTGGGVAAPGFVTPPSGVQMRAPIG